MTEKRLILIILLIGALLLISPINAKMVTAKVDDKRIDFAQSIRPIGKLHTQYGEIAVSDADYNKVKINDTIQYNDVLDGFWHSFWEIKVVE